MYEISYFTPSLSINQAIDTVVNDITNPIDFFKVKAQEATSIRTRDNLLYAVDALCSFAGESETTFDSFTPAMVGEWVSLLLFHGYSPKTISNNVLKRIATLYNKAVEAGLATPTDVFRNFQNSLESTETILDFAYDSGIFGKIREIIQRDFTSDARLQLAKDILLFSIYMGGMDIEDIVKYKKDDYTGSSNAIAEIVKRYSRPKNKYLFPLDRINATPKKLHTEVKNLLREILGRYEISISAVPSDTTFALWAYIAMSCGVSASDTAACIAPRHRRISVTAFAVSSDLSERQIAKIRQQVESTLCDNPIRWYAMHLRQHTDFDMLSGRMKEKDITLDEIYYPMEDVLRKVGKKNFFESKPVIAWLVFFRSRVTRLNSLYREIGDLAWGYRYRPDFRSPYAVIGDDEIRHYQQSIGTLSESTRILTDDEVKFNEGDYLVILGGPMNGRHGTFVAEKKEKGNPSGRVVFRIKLAGGSNANWEVKWDPALVRKISEDQYMELDRLFRESLNEKKNA